MNDRYVIRWRSKVNGRSGSGKKTFEREEARQLMEELNREYPQIEHEMVEARQAPEAEEIRSVLDPAPVAG